MDNHKRCQEPFIDKRGEFGYRKDMGRPKRSSPGGWIYHVLNRANADADLYEG